jgi:hypothetical protein
MDQAALMQQLIAAIVERGVTFDGSEGSLNLAYDSKNDTIFGFRLMQMETDHLKANDPRLIDKAAWISSLIYNTPAERPNVVICEREEEWMAESSGQAASPKP